LDPHLLQGTDDAAGDRAAIGYQDFIEHGSPDLQVVLRNCHALGRPSTLFFKNSKFQPQRSQSTQRKP
jgi:hypothetical protein